MKEKFVRINTIEGYENIKDYYWISNSDEDKIMNKDTGKQMKIGFDKDGYKRVNLMTNQGKARICYLHVMKASTFLFSPNPLNYNVVRHLNDCKADNALTNLAWGTQSDNVKDCIRNGNFNYEAAAKDRAIGSVMTAKKTSKPVRCIETGIIYPSACEAERQTGIHNANINHCCNNRQQTAGSFHWEFVNQIAE